jgi:hypothetical protein
LHRLAASDEASELQNWVGRSVAATGDRRLLEEKAVLPVAEKSG